MFMSIYAGPHAVPPSGAYCALSWTSLNVASAHPFGRAEAGVAQDADLVFVLSRNAPAGAAIAVQAIDTPIASGALMRLDEVCFPVGAIAHRHTHAGQGFRHLVRGSLRIEAESGSKVMNTHDSWFEPEATPVRAVALQSDGVSSFVRCMIIAPAYQGKSTFQLVDPDDAHLPRLQLTHRHMDVPIQLDAG